MTYRHAKDVPPSWQWAADSPRPGYSAANQDRMKSVNCGPSVVNRMAEFYQDADFNTWQTRNLGTSDPYKASFASEQKVMLERRGVAARLYFRPSLATLKSLIDTGRRPIGVAMYMARVPANIKDHPFAGMHLIELTHNERRGGVGGVGFFDPNFSKRRPDPDNGRKWMPDSVLDYAFWDSKNQTRSVALVPDRIKLVSLPDTGSEDELDATRHIPIAVATVAPGGTVYADANRKVKLIQSWPGQSRVGLYARPSRTGTTPGPLAPILIDHGGKLRVAYVGWDKVSNIRLA